MSRINLLHSRNAAHLFPYFSGKKIQPAHEALKLQFLNIVLIHSYAVRPHRMDKLLAFFVGFAHYFSHDLAEAFKKTPDTLLRRFFQFNFCL
jgi:hypothetical protein